jgi:hypothetical protein
VLWAQGLTARSADRPLSERGVGRALAKPTRLRLLGRDA